MPHKSVAYLDLGYTRKQRRLKISVARITRSLTEDRGVKVRYRNVAPLAYLSATAHTELCNYILSRHGIGDPPAFVKA